MQDDKFSLITEYNIYNNEEFKKMCYNLQSSHFTNLQILRVNNCYEKFWLDNFLSMLAYRSHKFEIINIEKCLLNFFFVLIEGMKMTKFSHS